MEIKVFEEFNPTIERGTLKACELCGEKFNLITKEHQCKRCFRAVCSSCVTEKKDVYKQNNTNKPGEPSIIKGSHKPCKPCSAESDMLKEYIKVNKLQFGKDSVVSKKWADKTSTLRSSQLNIKKHRNFPFETFKQLWESYNYSLREFIALLTLDKDQKKIHEQVNNVYIELQSRGIEEKMETLILLIMFILCFSSSDACVDLVEYLCELKKNIADSKQLIFTYLKTLGIEENLYKQINDYINYQNKHFIGPLSINAITAEASIHLISKAFEKQRIDETYMLLAIVLQENFAELLKNKGAKVNSDLLIIRNCILSNYTAKFKKLASVNISQISSLRAKRNSIGRDSEETFDEIIDNKTESTEQVEYETSSFSKKKYAMETESDSMSSPEKVAKSELNIEKKNREIKNNLEDENSEKSQNSSFSNDNSSRLGKSRSDGIEVNSFNLFAQFAQAATSKKNDEEIENSNKTEIVSNGRTKNEENVSIFDKKSVSEISNIKENQSRASQESFASSDSSSVEKNSKYNDFTGIKPNNSFIENTIETNYKKDLSSSEKIKENEISLPQKIKQTNEKIDTKIEISELSPKRPVLVENNIKLDKKAENNVQSFEFSVDKKNNEEKINEKGSFERSETIETERKLGEAELRIKNLMQELKQLKESKSKEEETRNEKAKQETTDIESLQKIVKAYSKEKEEGLIKFNEIKKENLFYQKECENLKYKVEELTLANKIMKQKIEQSENSSPIVQRINQNEDEVLKMNEMLKKSLQTKNQEMQVLIKNNKELTFKLESFKESIKIEQLEKEREGLLQKMKELSEKVVTEEGEKLELSHELFEFRRQSEIQISTSTVNSITLENDPETKSTRSVTDCVIF